MVIKAIVFDLGGVLITDFRQGGKNPWAGFLGIDEDSFEKVYSNEWFDYKMGKISELEAWCAFEKNGSKLSAREIYDLVRSTRKFVPGTKELIEELKGKYLIAALSNEGKETIEDAEERMGIDKLFDRMFVSCFMGLAKPDKRIYEKVLEELGMKVDEIVFVDDKERNITAAEEVGIDSILFESAEQTKKELQSRGLL